MYVPHLHNRHFSQSQIEELKEEINKTEYEKAREPLNNEIKEIINSIPHKNKYMITDNDIFNYITNLQEENKKSNNIIDKINKLLECDTHCENIYYAIGVLLNHNYFDIEDIENEEILNILQGSDKE